MEVSSSASEHAASTAKNTTALTALKRAREAQGQAALRIIENVPGPQAAPSSGNPLVGGRLNVKA